MATNVSSIGTTGRDYATITLWEDDVDGDLVSAGNIEKGECYADSDFNETVDIDGSVTDSSNYMWLTVAEGERHNGTAHGGGVVIDRNASNGQVLRMSDDYTVVEWLRIYNAICSGSARTFVGLYNTGCMVRNLILHELVKSTDNFYPISAAANTRVFNCIIYDVWCAQAGEVHRGISSYSSTKVYNNTVYNIKNQSGNMPGIWGGIQKNNIAADCDIDFAASQSGSNYNLSSDSTAPGANSITGKTASDQFQSITGGSEDFHLKAGADALDAGIGPSSDSNVPSTDIDGDSRSGATCDIGCDEYQESGVTVPVLAYRHYRNRRVS